jgi:hypothetical protein
VGRLLRILLVLVLVASCQNETHSASSPLPSPTPHTLPTIAILQPADLPAGLTACLGSGPIDVYLATLAASNPTLGARVAAEWGQLRGAGALAGAVSIYAADPSACAAELGATATVKAAASLVAIFADSGQADRAWQAGVFGFKPPAPGEVAPGVTLGSSTGLGLSSFTYVSSPVRLACWHRSVFVALVVLSNLDQATLAPATAALDARLN